MNQQESICQQNNICQDSERAGRFSTGTVISLILKAIVVISVIVGTVLSAIGGRAAFMGGRYVFMYFTIQSNLAIALICAIGFILLLRRKQIGNAWFVIKFMGTIAISLTGLVFCFVLAPTLASKAWSVHNVLTHVVVPVLSVVDFFITGIRSKLKNRHIFFVMLPPLAYAIFAGIGYINNWHFSAKANYPYFFLNWGSPAGAFGFTNELPYMGCGWWIIAILILLVLLGLLYLWVLKMIKKKSQNCFFQ